MIFGHEVDEAIRQHAVESYPKEAGGVVLDDQSYVRLENIAPDPESNFKADEATLFPLRPKIVGVSHSHPYPRNPPFPSAADIKAQLAWNVPWAVCATDGEAAEPPIWWGEGVPIPRVIGRPFRHGPSGSDGRGDCFALVRDVFRLARAELAEQDISWPFSGPVRLPEFPRNDQWWRNGEDLFTRFEEAGFREIRRDQVLPGDGCVMRIHNDDPPCHSALFLEGGLILHHFPNRLSRREVFGPWEKRVVRYFRYVG